MKIFILAFAISATAAISCAQTPGPASPTTCLATATSCSVSNQTVGDTSTPSSASGTTSNSSLSGNSSASNASGINVNPTNTAETTQNSTNTTTGTIAGGNTSGTITGGNTASKADGNTSNNSNQSSALTGASTSSSGGNVLGGASATTGDNKNANANTNGANTNGANTGTNTSTNKASNTGTNTSANTTGASTSGSSVDASDHSSSSYSEKTIFIPSVIPITPPSVLAVGNIMMETSACGPLQHINRIPVRGTFFGLVRHSKIEQGYTDQLTPYVDEHGIEQQYKRVPLANGRGYTLFGHQITQYTTILGVSGVRNIALGGGGGSGSWGQAGMGTSASNQQLVTTIEIRSCEIGIELNEEPKPTTALVAPPPPLLPVPTTIFVEPKHIRE